jgi:hypothetical protein
MKVSGSDRVSGASLNKGGAARAAGGFSVGPAAQASSTASATPTSGVTGVASIDALLALQAVGDPMERRKRAVKRASRILDVLDDVKVALLDGALSPNSLSRLMEAIREERGDTEDPRLEDVLDQIELRAAVELAKLEPLRTAA